MLVNLTPHDIVFFDCLGNHIETVAPSGAIARVSQKTEMVGNVGLIPVTKTVFGEVENLPEPKAGTSYIVSSIVAQRCPDREDVFVPSDSVRDDHGRIIGCRALGRVEAPKRTLTADEAAAYFGFCDAEAAMVAAYHS